MIMIFLYEEIEHQTEKHLVSEYLLLVSELAVSAYLGPPWPFLEMLLGVGCKQVLEVEVCKPTLNSSPVKLSLVGVIESSCLEEL